MQHRVLIVGTVPYNKMSSSRAFDSYFHFFQKENLAQIFSNTKEPCKGHCKTLFQITDHRIMKRWFSSKVDTGVIYNFDDLKDEWTDNRLEIGNKKVAGLYRRGSRHTPFTHLMRGILWRKRFWCTDKLNKWLDDFNPECVFLAFSDDYFIPRIALYVAERYNIPIVSCIGDDYYFNLKKTVSPVYWLYKLSYRRLIKRVFSHPSSAIYISDKIRDKYNTAFGLDGETVYLTSEVKRREFRPIDTKDPIITYCGNIRVGRNKSLCDIASALKKIDNNYRVRVFSNELDAEYYSMLENHPNIVYGGAVTYAEVARWNQISDLVLVVEGFDKESINKVRYSLSTKAADALSSGAAILTYGDKQCGAVEYMAAANASVVCTDSAQLESMIKSLFSDIELQKRLYNRSKAVSERNHTLEVSTGVFESLVDRVVEKKGKK